jgi:hypothetical protein
MKRVINKVGIFNKPFYYKLYDKHSKFWIWLFEEKKDKNGHTVVIRYRIFQKILELIPNILIMWWILAFLGFTWCGLIVSVLNLICILLTHYYMVYDFKYFDLLGIQDLAKSYKSVYWLETWFFLGHFIFKPYSYEAFEHSYKCGRLYLLVVPIITLITILWRFI